MTRRGKGPAPEVSRHSAPPPIVLTARASQDDVATVASVATIWASELLPGLAVEAAHPVAATAPADEHSAVVHEMSLLQGAQRARSLPTLQSFQGPSSVQNGPSVSVTGFKMRS